MTAKQDRSSKVKGSKASKEEKKGGKSKALITFSQLLFEWAPPEDLAAYDAAALDKSARYGYEALESYRKGKSIISVDNSIERHGRPVSVITIVFPDGRSFHTRGECVGQIAHQRIGYNGFGYDPIFQVGEGRSFASIPPEEKDAMSHRGKALRLFVEELKKYL